MATVTKKQCFKYERRRPELTPCYQIIQRHLETFLEERTAEGRPLPEYVIKEFDAYLKCGIPAHGFLRLVCGGCESEKIVAFSCKLRGFCPSCCAKRMAEAAAHLVDNVLPLIPYRQFVITFPIPLRYWINSNKKLFAKIHKIIISNLHQYYIDKAKAQGIKEPKPGTISFTQRWGSALNLNPHLHILSAEGVYSKTNNDIRFNNVEDHSDDDVAALLKNISEQVLKYLKKQGYLDKDGEVVANPLMDELFQENEAITAATHCSIAGKIAFGPNAGKYVTKIGSGFGFAQEIPLAKGKRCFSINGFSIHANTKINTHSRDRLEKLIQYIARGPLSNERLEITKDHNVKLRLKTQFSNGSTHLLFTPSEFIEKLCALIPPSRIHLVRWGGCFAPNSPLRKKITLKPAVKKGFQFRDEDTSRNEPKRTNYTWAKMLARVFKIDVLECECGGQLTPVAAVVDTKSIKRYLLHIGVDSDPPPRDPANYNWENLDFEGNHHIDETEPVIHWD